MSFSNQSDLAKEKNNKKESEVAILSILDKSYYNRNIPENNIEIPSKLLSSYENKEKSQDNNITLFNALYNSLINKDHKSFLFCIQQNNEILIEETVKQMNSDCLLKFIEKSVDIFQSNSFYSKMLLPWLKNVIKHKKLEIFRKKNIENLKKIQVFIKDKIKCFDALCVLKHKIEKINQIFCENKKNKYPEVNKEKNNDEKNNINDDKPIIFEPLLTYYESEDEEETKMKEMKKDKMEIEGFEEAEKDEEENEENNEMNSEKEESEEDDLDEEIDSMFLDENEKIKSKKEDKKDEEDKSDEEEENEDNIEEDD